MTPAMNVPKAGERPTSIIKNAMPSTISKEINVLISGKRDAWTKRNTGRVRKWPASIMPRTMPKVIKVTAHPGSDCTKVNNGSAAGQIVFHLHYHFLSAKKIERRAPK